MITAAPPPPLSPTSQPLLALFSLTFLSPPLFINLNPCPSLSHLSLCDHRATTTSLLSLSALSSPAIRHHNRRSTTILQPISLPHHPHASPTTALSTLSTIFSLSTHHHLLPTATPSTLSCHQPTPTNLKPPPPSAIPLSHSTLTHATPISPFSRHHNLQLPLPSHPHKPCTSSSFANPRNHHRPTQPLHHLLSLLFPLQHHILLPLFFFQPLSHQPIADPTLSLTGSPFLSLSSLINPTSHPLPNIKPSTISLITITGHQQPPASHCHLPPLSSATLPIAHHYHTPNPRTNLNTKPSHLHHLPPSPLRFYSLTFTLATHTHHLFLSLGLSTTLSPLIHAPNNQPNLSGVAQVLLIFGNVPISEKYVLRVPLPSSKSVLR